LALTPYQLHIDHSQVSKVEFFISTRTRLNSISKSGIPIQTSLSLHLLNSFLMGRSLKAAACKCYICCISFCIMPFLFTISLAVKTADSVGRTIYLVTSKEFTKSPKGNKRSKSRKGKVRYSMNLLKRKVDHYLHKPNITNRRPRSHLACEFILKSKRR